MLVCVTLPKSDEQLRSTSALFSGSLRIIGNGLDPANRGLVV